MATTDTPIGPLGVASHPRNGDDIGASEEFSTAYQAGFAAGFATGRETGLKEAREAGVTQLPPAAIKKTSARPSRRRKSARLTLVPPSGRHGVRCAHFLLGLPCRNCGAYFGSDEERCPLCKTSPT